MKSASTQEIDQSSRSNKSTQDVNIDRSYRSIKSMSAHQDIDRSHRSSIDQSYRSCKTTATQDIDRSHRGNIIDRSYRGSSKSKHERRAVDHHGRRRSLSADPRPNRSYRSSKSTPQHSHRKQRPLPTTDHAASPDDFMVVGGKKGHKTKSSQHHEARQQIQRGMRTKGTETKAPSGESKTQVDEHLARSCTDIVVVARESSSQQLEVRERMNRSYNNINARHLPSPKQTRRALQWVGIRAKAKDTIHHGTTRSLNNDGTSSNEKTAALTIYENANAKLRSLFVDLCGEDAKSSRELTSQQKVNAEGTLLARSCSDLHSKRTRAKNNGRPPPVLPSTEDSFSQLKALSKELRDVAHTDCKGGISTGCTNTTNFQVNAPDPEASLQMVVRSSTGQEPPFITEGIIDEDLPESDPEGADVASTDTTQSIVPGHLENDGGDSDDDGGDDNDPCSDSQLQWPKDRQHNYYSASVVTPSPPKKENTAKRRSRFSEEKGGRDATEPNTDEDDLVPKSIKLSSFMSEMESNAVSPKAPMPPPPPPPPRSQPSQSLASKKEDCCANTISTGGTTNQSPHKLHTKQQQYPYSCPPKRQRSIGSSSPPSLDRKPSEFSSGKVSAAASSSYSASVLAVSLGSASALRSNYTSIMSAGSAIKKSERHSGKGGRSRKAVSSVHQEKKS